MSNEKILAELSKPFHPSAVEWKPGATAKDGTKAMALAYVDVRGYQNRLDDLLGLAWSVTYTTWADRIICHLTIDGVTRSATGEADAQDAKNGMAGSVAEAMAFKRACASFGLGRYLYDLPDQWAEFDPQRKQFTEQAKAKLAATLMTHYKRSLGVSEPEPQRHPQPDSADVTLMHLRTLCNELGEELYGDAWPNVAKRNVAKLAKGSTGIDELTPDQLQTMITGLGKIKASRATIAEAADKVPA